jgi:hypothetical protein
VLPVSVPPTLGFALKVSFSFVELCMVPLSPGVVVVVGVATPDDWPSGNWALSVSPLMLVVAVWSLLDAGVFPLSLSGADEAADEAEARWGCFAESSLMALLHACCG